MFRAALRAFPRRVRASMVDEAVDTFEAAYRVRRRQGRLAALRYLLLAAADAVRAGVREHLERQRVPRSRNPVSGGDYRRRALHGTRLLTDVRQALRIYRRRPLVAACVTGVIAIGIAATAAVFSVIDGVLLQPLPWHEPDRVVWLQVTRGTETIGMANPLDVADWRADARMMSVAAFGTYEATLNVDGAVRVGVAEVSEGFGDVLGVRALHGRMLAEEDYARGAHRAVVSYELWRDHLGSDPAALGRTLLLDQRPYTVVGVLPDLPVRFPLERPGVWVPLQLPAPGDQSQLSRSGVWLWGIARLSPGVDRETAAAEIRGIAAALRQRFPDSNRERDVNLLPVRELLVGPVGPVLLLLAGAVALVLLVAAANVGNLLMVVAYGRRHEFAIRASLGAAHGRLARQILAESLLLALTGGLFGLVLAPGLLRTLIVNYPGGLPRAAEVGIYVPGLLAGAGAMLVAAMGAALPGLHQLRRQNVQSTLRSSERGGLTRGDRQVRSGLVAAQVALSIMLLFAGAVLWRSFDHLNRTEVGVASSKNLLTFNLALNSMHHRSAAEEASMHVQMLDRFLALPGVHAAGTSTLLPFAPGEFLDGFAREGHSEDVLPDLPTARLQNVTPGFLEALGVQLLAGRAFTAADREGGVPVVVVNRALERAYFPGGAVGRNIDFRGTQRAIVGVVSDKRHRDMRTSAVPELYVPKAQSDYPRLLAWVVVRTQGDPLTLVPAVRRIVEELDPTASLDDVRTMDARIDSALAPDRFRALCVAGLSVTAMLLALIGLWGLIGYSVAVQSREIGIRMALGESPHGALRRVLLSALRIAGSGTLIGVLLAFAGARLLEGFVAGIQARDVPTLSAVAASFLIAAMLAALGPARRASAVAPAESIRHG